MAGPTPDLDLDVNAAVGHLLGQQADIQARLAALLGSRHVFHHGLSLPEELDMLRHKLRVLESVVDHHGMSACFSVSVSVRSICLFVFDDAPSHLSPTLSVPLSLLLASLSLIRPLQHAFHTPHVRPLLTSICVRAWAHALCARVFPSFPPS